MSSGGTSLHIGILCFGTFVSFVPDLVRSRDVRSLGRPKVPGGGGQADAKVLGEVAHDRALTHQQAHCRKTEVTLFNEQTPTRVWAIFSLSE